MTRNPQNDVNQNGEREHDHPHGQPLPHLPTKPNRAAPEEKREGKPGQPNFIPGQTPVSEPGRNKA